MTPTALLNDLARQGFALAAEGTGIRVTPASRLTGELRQAIRSHKVALLALFTRPKHAAAIFPWDQAEVDRLLAQLREALARVEAAVAAGKAPAVRAAALGTWLEVGEGYVRDRDLEAARGWDAMDLLRSAVARAMVLAA